MAVRAPKWRPQTPRADRHRLHRRTPAELLGYAVTVVISLGVAWALASLH